MPEDIADPVLDLPMGCNQGCGPGTTVRAYFKAMLRSVWLNGMGFSASSPFGRDGWQFDLYHALIRGGLVAGKIGSDGYIIQLDEKAADRIIYDAIERM